MKSDGNLLIPYKNILASNHQMVYNWLPIHEEIEDSGVIQKASSIKRVLILQEDSC